MLYTDHMIRTFDSNFSWSVLGWIGQLLGADRQHEEVGWQASIYNKAGLCETQRLQLGHNDTAKARDFDEAVSQRPNRPEQKLQLSVIL